MREDVTAIYFVKNFSKLFNTTGTLKDDLESNVFLINKKVYNRILDEFKHIASSTDDFKLLNIIREFVDLSDINPSSFSSFTDAINEKLVVAVNQGNVVDPPRVIAFIKSHFSDLFDFPISIPEIIKLEVSGIFQVKTIDNKEITTNDLVFYDLSLEYSNKTSNNSGGSYIMHFDWLNNQNIISENKVSFSFTENSSIILNSINGFISVKVKSFDGSTLWSKDYEANDFALRNILIVVPLQRPVTLTSLSKKDLMDKNKKLRGQVLELGNKCSLNNVTVVIQAKKDGDEFWRIVGAANTDKSGNFSMPYPYGVYKQLQAIISLTPDSPADIPVNEGGKENETIDEFLYLLIKETEANCVQPDTQKVKKDDCNCNAIIKARRLPDHTDLIDSNEYTQDIGGSCINLTTPNRTLSEYTYRAVVRTSDPHVSNYILTKSTEKLIVPLTYSLPIVEIQKFNLDGGEKN